MSYTNFKIYYPAGTTGYTPDEPRDDLLQGVIDCGIIDADVLIEYDVDNSGDFVSVPEVTRQAARDWWANQ